MFKNVFPNKDLVHALNKTQAESPNANPKLQDPDPLTVEGKNIGGEGSFIQNQNLQITNGGSRPF